MTNPTTPVGTRHEVVTASAPGKLMLLGEYAVLDGAPAVVAAVNRRATATIRPTGRTEPPVRDGSCRVVAPDIGADVTCVLGPRQAVTWPQNLRSRGRLDLVSVLLARALAAGVLAGNAPALEVHLATSAFFSPDRSKLGLGSSAALTVALSGALAALAGRPAPTLAGLVAAHRAAQSGRGSGADIAASRTGGVIDYRGADTDRPRAVVRGLPAGLSWCCVWTGRSTSTAAQLTSMAAWRGRNGAEYTRHLEGLTATATAGAAAAADGSPAAFLDAFARYGVLLDALGCAAGVDIVGAEHRELRALADRCGVVYKPSGSGGGDVGVAMADDPTRLLEFAQQAEDGGYHPLDVAIDPLGLVVEQDGGCRPPSGREG